MYYGKEIKHYIDIEIVKKLMIEKSIDKKTMANRMEITVPTIHRFLSGADQRHMSSDIVLKLAIALGVPANVIFHKDYR